MAVPAPQQVHVGVRRCARERGTGGCGDDQSDRGACPFEHVCLLMPKSAIWRLLAVASGGAGVVTPTPEVIGRPGDSAAHRAASCESRGRGWFTAASAVLRQALSVTVAEQVALGTEEAEGVVVLVPAG